MSDAIAQTLATAVLGLHLAVIAFNLFGLSVVPIGVWRGWAFVRAPTWRLLHLASLAVVVAQAASGRICFLTLWQADLTGAQVREPLIARWVDAAIYWPLPLWVFNLIYLALFAYALGLLWLAPLRWRRRR